jgi:hypothetical protein
MAFIQTQKLTPSDVGANDNAGYSVSISGTRVAIGAPNHDGAGVDQGAVYIFDLIDSTWTQSSKITPSDPSNNDGFGRGLSLYNDRLVIGAPKTDDAGTDSGSVYVFDYNGTTWNQTQKISPSESVFSDTFGWSIKLEQDRFIVGALSSTGTPRGFIYELSGTWSESAVLKPTVSISGVPSLVGRGIPVDLSGSRAVVGFQLSSNGSAFVFDLSGTAWSQTAEIKPSDIKDGDSFALATSLDADRLAIGSLDNVSGVNQGAVYVFDLSGGSWNETQKLSVFGLGTDDQFGSTFALDGGRIIAGAPGESNSGSNRGSAYVFDLTGTSWIQTQKITTSDTSDNDLFGFDISLEENQAIISSTGLNASYIFDGSSLSGVSSTATTTTNPHSGVQVTLSVHDPETGEVKRQSNSVNFRHNRFDSRSDVEVVSMNVSGVTRIKNIQLGIVRANPIELNGSGTPNEDGSVPNGNFGIENSKVFSSRNGLSSYFNELNTNESSNNSNNVSIETRTDTSSGFVYLNVNVGSDVERGFAVYKWFFDFF